jgi:hypothetical protein
LQNVPLFRSPVDDDRQFQCAEGGGEQSQASETPEARSIIVACRRGSANSTATILKMCRAGFESAINKGIFSGLNSERHAVAACVLGRRAIYFADPTHAG